MSKRFFLLTCCFVLFIASAPISHAEETTIVYAESGRFSLEMPAGWVTGELPRSQTGMSNFVGETILIADSETTLENWASGSATGQIILARLESSYGTADTKPMERLRSYIDNLSMQTTEPEIFELNGHLAARYMVSKMYSDHVFPDAAEQVGQTIIVAGYFVYNIMYTGPDLAALETIADSLTIHSLPAITDRPPLSINDVLTLPVEPGWMVMKWRSVNPLTGWIGHMQNSMPEYMLILTEAYSTFLDAINSSFTRGPSAQTMDLPGAYILVGVFPYDAMLGSGTAAVDDEKRLDIFEKIADGQQFRYDEVTTQQINGLPALMAQSTKVLGRDTNQGTLLVIDANPHFYAITIAGPQARWLTDYAPMADLVLDQLTVTPPVVTEEGNQVGQRAPDFTATLIDGSSVSLSDYRGKFVLLDFWATWCEPCREEIPSLQKAYEERDNLVVLAIDFLEDEGTVSAFARTNKITFPMALDLTGEVNYLYKVSGYPTNYLINKEGIIIDISLGGMPSLHQVK